MESLAVENDKIIESTLSEIIDSDGKIKNIIDSSFMVKIKSKITNFIRYDIISKTDSVTYQVPEFIKTDIKDIFS